VTELLTTLPPDAEPLAWTSFAISGQCPDCGEQFDPDPAATEATLACSSCDSPIRPDVSRWLREAAPHARLRDLGIAPEEIIAIRGPEGGYRWLRTAA